MSFAFAKRHRTSYIVIHCSATPPSSDIGADEIDDWHRKRGWSGIGYHAVIRRDGEIEFGRHFDEAGAHVQGQNYQSVGVCLVGGVDDEGKPANNFTTAQMLSLKLLIVMLHRAYSSAEILGHRDLSPDMDGDGVVEKHEWVKECPSFDVRAWWSTVNGVK